MKLTAKAINNGRYGWMVQWSDGAYTFEPSESDARTCEQFPTLTHPVAVQRAEEYNRGYEDAMEFYSGRPSC